MSKPRDGGADRGADRGASGRQVDERICSYVDGCLSPRDQERFVAELRVNAQLQKDLEEYQRTVEAVREALRAPTVPTRLADRVMAAIGTPAAPPRRAPVRTWQSLLWSVAAAAALLALALWLNAWEGGPSRTTLAEMPALDSSSVQLPPVPRPADQDPEPKAPVVPEHLRAEREALVPPGGTEPLVRKLDPVAPAATAIPVETGVGAAPAPAPAPSTAPAGVSEPKEERGFRAFAREKDKVASAAKAAVPDAPVPQGNDDPANVAELHREATATPGAEGGATVVPPAVPETRHDRENVDGKDSSARGGGGSFGAPAGGVRRGGRGGAPAGRTEPLGPLPLVVITADAKQVAAALARGRAAETATGADDFYLGSTRKARAAAEEVPQLFGFLMQQFPDASGGPLAGLTSVSLAPPQQVGDPGSARDDRGAKSAPRSGPATAGPAGPGAPSAPAPTPLELQLLGAAQPAPVFSHWQSLRFEELAVVPKGEDAAPVDHEQPSAAAPGAPRGERAGAGREQAAAAAGERTWLVEGRRTEVAELLRRLAALARESGFQVRNGELPADAPVLSARFRKTVEPSPSADDTAAPVVPPASAGGGATSTLDRDSMRIVLRFQTR